MVASPRTIRSARRRTTNCCRCDDDRAASRVNADPGCDQTVGDSINSYLIRHPDVKQRLSSQSQAEGGGPDVIDYLNRHPDVRRHLIELSQQCAP